MAGEDLPYVEDAAGFRRINDDYFREAPTTVSGALSWTAAKKQALAVAREQMLKAVHDHNRAMLAAMEPSGWSWVVSPDPHGQVTWDFK